MIQTLKTFSNSETSVEANIVGSPLREIRGLRGLRWNYKLLITDTDAGETIGVFFADDLAPLIKRAEEAVRP